MPTVHPAATARCFLGCCCCCILLLTAFGCCPCCFCCCIPPPTLQTLRLTKGSSGEYRQWSSCCCCTLLLVLLKLLGPAADCCPCSSCCFCCCFCCYRPADIASDEGQQWREQAAHAHCAHPVTVCLRQDAPHSASGGLCGRQASRCAWIGMGRSSHGVALPANGCMQNATCSNRSFSSEPLHIKTPTQTHTTSHFATSCQSPDSC